MTTVDTGVAENTSLREALKSGATLGVSVPAVVNSSSPPKPGVARSAFLCTLCALYGGLS